MAQVMQVRLLSSAPNDMDSIKEHAVPLVVMFGTTILGLTGLYLEIPHSGWVLAVGIVAGLFHDWT